jgi:hypothetical protein
MPSLIKGVIQALAGLRKTSAEVIRETVRENLSRLTK